jgi:hypothetical protein
MSRSQSIPKQRTTVPTVEIKAVTWNKDSHGLFDYENSYYDMKKFQLTKSVRLYRNKNEILSQEKSALDEEIEPESEYLLSLTKDPNQPDKYHVDVPGDFPAANRISRPIYLIIRSLKCKDGRSQRGYTLQPGDIMKLGRIDYRILEIANKEQVLTNNPLSNDLVNLMPSLVFDGDAIVERPTTEESLCKYCLMEHISEDPLLNLMLHLCKCKEGVHYQCLKSWMQYKIVAKASTNIISYQWKKLDCEICLTPWPRKIKFQNHLHELITVEKPSSPYIIIEKLSQDSSASSTMSIIIPDGTNQIKLGRGHQCDLRISDISVSRVHALLKYEDDKFLVFDNDSKFGTLILLTQNHPVKYDKAAVQIGRTVFTFVLKNVNSEAGRSSQQLPGNPLS